MIARFKVDPLCLTDTQQHLWRVKGPNSGGYLGPGRLGNWAGPQARKW